MSASSVLNLIRKTKIGYMVLISKGNNACGCVKLRCSGCQYYLVATRDVGFHYGISSRSCDYISFAQSKDERLGFDDPLNNAVVSGSRQ